MKAIIYTEYGSPDVLGLKDIGKPSPKENEVLIKIISASVNAADWHMIRGKPFIARFTSGLLKPKTQIPGIDFAGIVETSGKKATEFKPGDEVFGDCGWGGAFAEYVCLKEEKIIPKPENVTFDEAASIPVSALTALQSIRDFGKITSGQQVLINGSSGGVGTFSIQIAKYYGAEVTGVCSTPKMEMVKSIGADNVIDYNESDFCNSGKKFDVIIDNVGNRSIFDLERALKPSGKCIIVGFTSLPLLFQAMFISPVISSFSTKKIKMMGTAVPNKKDMLFLKVLLESGKIKPVIEKTYSLEQAAEAVKYVDEGHATGKIIINTAG